MKLLSIIIPCYNSESYMHYAIESLVVGGEDVEILLINDGSTDETEAIANHYAEKYPKIVTAIHQANGGHGEAINTGLKHAKGLYFKVVDSDDWVDTRAYLKVLDTLKTFSGTTGTIDLLISNFVYEKQGSKYRKVMRYDNVLPKDTVFSWDDVKPFKKGQFMMMHAMIYRTNLLREAHLSLPKHTFYVDNLYVYTPLPYATRLFYLDVDFYRYFIGRSDQSVNESVMIRRIDQQLKVNHLMLEAIDLDTIHHERLRDYMLKHLEIVTVISAILLIKSGTKENLRKKRELMRYVKQENVELYVNLKYGLMGRLINLPGKVGRMISVMAYKISQKVIGFN
ncbi:glycosyl transferase [Halolactibacillus alkaliphilus]|uniref:Glycosyl transferase n=1 Tax=Halolactibacillus alkaliphilus TaxID=442899 RepID=A0A511X4E3_9BACI|nr:glycosyltransferase family 2 protein [Halolactibacillus alkaliphilus]GEN57822.1 glycosyl transferase [Halolactibacillus alkaliphilus]GGN75341.1 glycosyl transferase [Halolactibacillus alkaliphilus]SFP05792.1 Glycosyltransferase involved in cell wall bisynthesis [Halolactibacillus alkaliphilus]